MVAECSQHCDFMRSYVGLLHDAPHVAFELTLEAATGLALYPLLRRLRARFKSAMHAELDAEHGVEHKDVRT